MGTRRQSREAALQILYEMEMKDAEPRSVMNLYWRTQQSLQSFSDGVKEYTQELVEGVYRNRAEIDELIERHSAHWKIKRMAVVDRNLLRLGAYELCYRNDVPARVALDEAIEIAKAFGTEDSSSFINGILDSAAIELKKKETKPL